MSDKTIVILTAMNLEYKAVQARLSGITVETHPKGTRFEVGHLDNSDVRLALALVGRGNQPAAVITERAVSHFSPVAAGEIALYSGASDVRQWLREHYNDALAVEMEAVGVAQAGHLNDGLAAIMVRGISDFADSTKSATDGEGWQPRAVANAAAFATALAASLAAELGIRHTRDARRIAISRSTARPSVAWRRLADGSRAGRGSRAVHPRSGRMG